MADSLYYYPSISNLGESFEGWAYRKNHLRQIQRLEADAYLEKLPGGHSDRIYRLTPKGRLAALGGSDPETLWSRHWDKKWRIVLFDIPSSPSNRRQQLTATLRDYRLGCLQRSVWITPDPTDEICAKLKGKRHPASLTVFEGMTIAGEKPREIVQTAWPFDEITNDWSLFDKLLDQGTEILAGKSPDKAEAFRNWTKREQAAWIKLQETDPFLPKGLLPPNYPGPKIWKKRLRFWEKAFR